MEERIVAADPVGDPQSYQRELLALLGGRDPVAVLAATPRAVRERAGSLSHALLGRRPDPTEWSVAELLDAFTALRTANLALIRDTPEALWDRLGIHAERGPISFRLMTETMAGHDCAHLRQLQQTIVAV